MHSFNVRIQQAEQAQALELKLYEFAKLDNSPVTKTKIYLLSGKLG